MARRVLTGWLIGIAVVVALAWVGYWFAARAAAEAAIDRAGRAPVAGNLLGCSDRAIDGFPWRLTVRCRVASLANDRGVRAEVAGVEANAALWRPARITAEITGPMALNDAASGVGVTATWSLGRFQAAAWFSGLRTLSGIFSGLDVATAGPARIPVRAATAARVVVGADPVGNEAYRFAASAERLVVTSTLGGTLPEADLELRFTAQDFGASLGIDPREAFRDWLRRGASAEIHRIRLATDGLVVSGDGMLSVSPEGRLSGNLNLRPSDLQALANLVVRYRPGLRDDIDLIVAALMVMSTPVETPDGPARQTPLTITDGVVAVGIVPLPFVIPPLRF